MLRVALQLFTPCFDVIKHVSGKWSQKLPCICCAKLQYCPQEANCLHMGSLTVGTAISSFQIISKTQYKMPMLVHIADLPLQGFCNEGFGNSKCYINIKLHHPLQAKWNKVIDTSSPTEHSGLCFMDGSLTVAKTY